MLDKDDDHASSTVLACRQTRTGLKIGLQGRRLQAMTACCDALIHYNPDAGLSWKCAACGDVVRTFAAGTSPSSSVYFVKSGAESISLNTWVSAWTGIPEDMFTISVSNASIRS